MANRRSAMYQYRQVLTHMRLGDSDRAVTFASSIRRPMARARPSQSGDIVQAIRNFVST